MWKDSDLHEELSGHEYTLARVLNVDEPLLTVDQKNIQKS
jgi:hypothetical protein